MDKTPILEKLAVAEKDRDALKERLAQSEEAHIATCVDRDACKKRAEKMAHRISDLESVVSDRAGWQKGFESANRELFEVKKDRDAYKGKLKDTQSLLELSSNAAQ